MRGQLRVALVNMPWARIDAPSIQCGLLKALAVRDGHRCDVHYPNLDLAAIMGPDRYDGVSDMRSERLHMLGEWLFSYAAFGEIKAENDYFAEFPELAGVWEELTGGTLDDLVEFRRVILVQWLEKMVVEVDWGEYDLVGFTSTFLQNTASLAMGRLIKERHPQVLVVYGGANFDSEMGPEYAQNLPWLDYVVVGEADEAFPRLLAAVRDGTPVHAIPGVHGYGIVRVPLAGSTPSEPIRDMDSLPVPDYHEYFTALERHGRRRLLGNRHVTLPVEFSRGCWWGAKHHCTFCGLNSAGMSYRAKTGERALAELTTLLTEYPAVHVDAVDNILDMAYLSSLCEDLARLRWDINLFFEVKANLGREQLGRLRRAAIYRIQPGIESLNTHVLRLMRKGSTKLTNVRVLKWARYHGISVMWNVLVGLPGETDNDYAEQIALIPALHHLEPPSGSTQIWLERFSPYFTDPSFPFDNVRPLRNYGHVYPAALDHQKIAYFFDYDVDQVSRQRVRDQLSTAIAQWRATWSHGCAPMLVYRRLPGRITIVDTRGGIARQATLRGWQAAAYEACDDAPRSPAAVHRELAEAGFTVSADLVRRHLDQCCRAALMVEDEGHFLSLALPENPGW